MEKRRYLLCSVPRSGSGFVSYLLQESGWLGMNSHGRDIGWESLLEPARARFRDVDWSRNNALGVLDTAFAHSVSRGEIAGFKVMWPQLDALLRSGTGPRVRPPISRAAAERAIAGSTELIWLRRHDPVRQAVSWVKALQSGVWRSDFDSDHRSRCRYDYVLLRWRLNRIRREEGRWRAFFRRVGVVPHTLVYEDFADDPLHAVRSIARRLGVDVGPLEDLRSPYVKQADAVSEAWVRRFRHDDATRGRRFTAVVRALSGPALWRHVLLVTRLKPAPALGPTTEAAPWRSDREADQEGGS